MNEKPEQLGVIDRMIRGSFAEWLWLSVRCRTRQLWSVDIHWCSLRSTWPLHLWFTVVQTRACKYYFFNHELSALKLFQSGNKVASFSKVMASLEKTFSQTELKNHIAFIVTLFVASQSCYLWQKKQNIKTEDCVCVRVKMSSPFWEMDVGGKKNIVCNVFCVFCLSYINKSETLSFSSLFKSAKRIPGRRVCAKCFWAAVGTLCCRAPQPSLRDDAGEPSLEPWGEHERETFTSWPQVRSKKK